MRFSHLALCAAALTGVLTTPAYAYLDPGTGSMILQGAIAAVATSAAGLSLFWHRIKTYFSRQPDSSPSTDRDAPER